MGKKHYYDLNWKNKKAFIFTLDVAIAIAITALFLFATTNFVTKSNKDPFPNLQLIKYGSDVLKVLDVQGYLDSPNPDTISERLGDLVPSYYGMELIGYGSGSCSFTSSTGTLPPENQFTASGKYYFKSQSGFCHARYKIWVE